MNEVTSQHESLVIIIIGASGDLAHRKIYPSLLELFLSKFIVRNFFIWGYARSKKSHQSFRSQLKSRLLDDSRFKQNKFIVDAFLSKCFYQSGKAYNDTESYEEMIKKIEKNEHNIPNLSLSNRLFYLAIPPNIFVDAGIAIRKVCLPKRGWTRIIMEKPFGNDLDSCIQLLTILSKNFKEHQLYRIDHYLGKEMVQNMLIFRFSNNWIDKIWNRNVISSVLIEFKECIGTDGRGGYFDQYGIIRDVIQNHLIQILALVAMECPDQINGPKAGEAIRNSKVRILQSIPPIKIEDCVLGQYKGYRNDSTITDKNTKTPTYAALCCYINTPRWKGIPFIMTAGKALKEQKVVIRIRFRESLNVPRILPGLKMGANMLEIELQPKQSICMGTNIKTPGYSSLPIAKALELQYESMQLNEGNIYPDAYTRLLLDTLKGKQESFVRDDELIRSWEIFSPLLHKIDELKIKPHIYERGSIGPIAAKIFISRKTTQDLQNNHHLRTPHTVTKIRSAL